VGILNEEIRGPSSTAHHLEHTLRELRSLLGDPREMTELQVHLRAGTHHC
jgi:cohesin loading factor subunit SCC2